MTLAILLVAVAVFSPQQPPSLALRGGKVFTMTGTPIENGVVLVADGKIVAVGAAGKVDIPDGARVLEAAVVTPGLIDAHATVGLSGLYNVPHDQDQVEKSAPMQPELRALDAFHPKDELVAWVRSFGITTVHTGHSPGALIAGQTMVIKVHGRSVDQDVVVPLAMVATSLADSGRAGGKSPGTRAKSVAMLREELQKAREYAARRQRDPDTAIDLGLEVMAKVIAKEVPLLVTAHRSHDILSALRVQQEFGVRVVLDGAAEAYTVLPEIAKAGVWVLPHPTMARTTGDLANGTMELPNLLLQAKVPFALQSGYESYVPKTRVVLFEAGVAVGHGLPAEAALRALTVDAARLLGLQQRLGAIQVGMDADLAMFDGDPFEYATHCVGAVIDGLPYGDAPR